MNRLISRRAWAGTTLAAALLFAVAAQGSKSADVMLQLASGLTMQLQDQFDRKELGDGWKVAKGAWTIEDGALVGKELPADHHAAVASIGGPVRDSVLKLSFQLNGAKQFAVSLNKANGHLFRVMITEAGLTLALDKDKKNPESKGTILARAQGVIEPNVWHTLQLEMVGDQAAAQLDNGLRVAGRHESLACEKTGYRFVVSGESIRIDDVTISTVAR